MLIHARTTTAPLQGRKLESSRHDEATFRLNAPQSKGFRLIRAKIRRKIIPPARLRFSARQKSRNARRSGSQTRFEQETRQALMRDHADQFVVDRRLGR